MKRKLIMMLILIFGSIVILEATSSGKAAGFKKAAEAQKQETDPQKGNKEKTSNERQKKENKGSEKQGGEKENVIQEKPKIETESTENIQEQSTEKTEVESEKAEDTGTAPVTQNDDVSDGSKFKTYNNYENAALAKRNPNTIYQLSQLYFKDGLYQRAVELAKKDLSGDIRNLYVVAIGSRLMGQYDQSIDYYNRILAMSPNATEAKLGIGIAYKAKKDFSRALGYLRDYARTNGSQEVMREIAILNELVAGR